MSNPRNATTTNRGRSYRWRDEEFDSVTTIIGGGVPKPALKAWGERTVAEMAFDNINTWRHMKRDEAVDWLKRSPFRTTNKAAELGSSIHDYAEAHVLGKPMPEPTVEQRPYLEALYRFLDDHTPSYQMTEATVYNREHNYAGTLDLIAEIPGLGLTLADYKSGKGVYGEVALQLAAYRFAEFVGMPNGDEVPMPEVDSCAVVHLTPDGYELIPVDAGLEEFRTFLYAARIRWFCNTRSRQVLLPPMAPTKEGAPA